MSSNLILGYIQPFMDGFMQSLQGYQVAALANCAAVERRVGAAALRPALHLSSYH